MWSCSFAAAKSDAVNNIPTGIASKKNHKERVELSMGLCPSQPRNKALGILLYCFPHRRDLNLAHCILKLEL